ncbi:MAG: amino acid ABC transporter permease [Nodosilinea sp.]
MPPNSPLPRPLLPTRLDWIRENLLSGWFNTLLTLGLGLLLIYGGAGFYQWVFATAKWSVIPTNLPLFFVGRFPADQYWRIWLLGVLIALLSGCTWGVLARSSARLFDPWKILAMVLVALVMAIFPLPEGHGALVRLQLLSLLLLLVGTTWIAYGAAQRHPVLGRWLSPAWGLMFLLGFWLMVGGLGLPPVSTTTWGGLLLTVFMSLISIALSFPFGVLLALGRQSTLPLIRWLSTLYIEVVRGIPLIAVLFMALIMIPLFLPSNWRLDLVLRAILGLTLFTAAYLAETVRGGLQAIPKGQYEAASSLGLNTPLCLALVVLPQALKISIPAIVGLFIALIQDTTLVSIVGLFDLLGMSRSILANPLFIGRYAEVYLFIGIFYWAICYAMSQGSRYLERQLNQIK